MTNLQQENPHKTIKENDIIIPIDMYDKVKTKQYNYIGYTEQYITDISCNSCIEFINTKISDYSREQKTKNLLSYDPIIENTIYLQTNVGEFIYDAEILNATMLVKYLERFKYKVSIIKNVVRLYNDGMDFKQQDVRYDMKFIL